MIGCKIDSTTQHNRSIESVTVYSIETAPPPLIIIINLLFLDRENRPDRKSRQRHRFDKNVVPEWNKIKMEVPNTPRYRCAFKASWRRYSGIRR